MAPLPWTEKGGEMAGGGIHGGRLGPQGAAALRRWAGDGERMKGCSVMSRSRRWRRLALQSGDRDKSPTAALRSRAPMAAVAFCRGRRGAQASKQRGGGRGVYGCGSQETEPCPARTPRGSAAVEGCPWTPASPGPARGGRRRQMGLCGGLVARLGAAQAGN
jgi:hypothetical protein